MLHHCGKQLTPVIQVACLTANELGGSELQWMPSRSKSGYVLLTSDSKMIAHHDIAALAIKWQAKIFMLKKEASQQKRWPLLKWFVIHLPKIAWAAHKSQPGTTYLVSYNGSLHPVLPTEFRSQDEKLEITV